MYANTKLKITTTKKSLWVPYTEKIKKKKMEFVGIRNQTRIRIHYPGCGSADPDPHQNETDPKHW